MKAQDTFLDDTRISCAAAADMHAAVEPAVYCLSYETSPFRELWSPLLDLTRSKEAAESQDMCNLRPLPYVSCASVGEETGHVRFCAGMSPDEVSQEPTENHTRPETCCFGERAGRRFREQGRIMRRERGGLETLDMVGKETLDDRVILVAYRADGYMRKGLGIRARSGLNSRALCNVSGVLTHADACSPESFSSRPAHVTGICNTVNLDLLHELG